MPSFLFQDQTPTIQPYQHPTELMLKSGLYRDAKFKEGLQNIRSRYDNLLSLQLTNAGNQQFVRDQLKTAVNQLDKYSTTDLSLPENVGALTSIFDPVTDDQGVMQDLAFTQHINRQKSIIDKLSVDDPDKVSPANVFPILQAEQSYRSGSRTARPNFVSFQPYHDFEKDDDLFLSKLKEDIYSDPSIITRRDPATGEIVQLQGEREVKEIAASKIRGALNNTFDAKKLAQMRLDYNYNVANGAYDPRMAVVGMEQDIRALNEKITANQDLLSNGGLSVDQTNVAERLISQGKAQIAKLSSLKEKIATSLRSPETGEQARQGALEYYTFGKYLDDYVQQKVSQYSTKQIGKFEVNDFDKAIWDYRMDSNLETLKAQLKAKNDKKSGSSLDSETGLQEDGSYEYEPPLKVIMDNVERTGNSTVDWQSPYILPLLGNARRNTNGSITYLNTGGGLDDPTKTIFIKEASGAVDPENAKLIEVNSAIGKTVQELQRMDPSYFMSKREFMRTPGGPLGSIQGPSQTVTEFSESEKINKLSEMLTKYKQNPNNFTKKAQGVLSQLNDTLVKAGVNTLDRSVIDKYNTFINSDQGKSIISAGVALNKDSKGQYEFVPDGSNNVLGLSDNRLGMSGYIVLHNDDLERMDLDEDKLIADGVLSRVAPEVEYSTVDDKVVKSEPERYWLKVILPVNGDLQDINKRMFEGKDIETIETKLKYPANRQQQSAFRQYLEAKQASVNELESSGQGSYRPKTGSNLSNQIDQLFNNLQTDKSVSPEQVQSVRDQYQQIISVPSTRFEAMQNLQRFISNVVGSATQAASNAQTAFVNNYYSIAKTVEMQTGVPAVLALAQAAVESGWGRSAPGSNFFGIKADESWRGPIQTLDTTEQSPSGQTSNTRANFRSYATAVDSFRDYARFLRNNPRYAAALRESDPYRVARGVARAGYATDRNYYDTISRVMKQIENQLNGRN